MNKEKQRIKFNSINYIIGADDDKVLDAGIQHQNDWNEANVTLLEIINE